MDDKAVIAVSSAQAVRDPVLVFRIGAGAQVREYTAILDPVGCSPKTKSALSDGKTHRKTAPKAESQENQNAKALRKTDKKDSANSAVKPAHNGKTHTVRKGETLKQIAAAIRPKHLTLEQVADALLKANPNVSAHGRLRAGSVLHIPNLNRIKAAAPKKIKAEQPKPQTAKPKAETASMPSEPSKQATVEKPIEKPVEKPVEKPEAKVAAPEAKAEKPAVRPEPKPAVSETPASATERQPGPVPAANTAASETAAKSAPPKKPPLLPSTRRPTKPVTPFPNLLRKQPVKLPPNPLPNLSNRFLPKKKPKADCLTVCSAVRTPCCLPAEARH